MATAARRPPGAAGSGRPETRSEDLGAAWVSSSPTPSPSPPPTAQTAIPVPSGGSPELEAESPWRQPSGP